MKQQKRKGFTLPETVLALGVVGVLIVAFVAMFYPARKIVVAAMTVQEADRIVNVLEDELSIVRKPERAAAGSRQSSRSGYVSAFDKAFYWMLSTDKPETAVLIYSYRGDLDKPKRDDGTLQPLEDLAYVPGKDSVLVTTACLATNRDRTKDLEFAVGPVFVVKMTQLVVTRQAGLIKYVLADGPGKIANPYTPGRRVTKPEDYVYNIDSKSELSWGDSVMYHAEFYQMAGRNPEGLKGMTWERFGKNKPVFTRDLVFRR